MKHYRQELWFEIPTRRAFVNITEQVQRCIDDSGIREGLVLVNAMHITASASSNFSTLCSAAGASLPGPRLRLGGRPETG